MSITKTTPQTIFSKYIQNGKNDYKITNFFETKPAAVKKKYINPISMGSFTSGTEAFLEFQIPENEFIVDIKFSENFTYTGTPGTMTWAPLCNINKVELWMNGSVFQSFDKHIIDETQYIMASYENKVNLATSNKYHSTPTTDFKFTLNVPYLSNLQNSSDLDFQSKIFPPVKSSDNPIFRIYFETTASNIYTSSSGAVWLPTTAKMAFYILTLTDNDKKTLISQFNNNTIPIYNSIAAPKESVTFSGTTHTQLETNMNSIKNKYVLLIISKIILSTSVIAYNTGVGTFNSKSGLISGSVFNESFSEDSFYDLKTKENTQLPRMYSSNIYTNYFMNSTFPFDIEKSTGFMFNNDDVTLQYNSLAGVTAASHDIINEILLVEGYTYKY